MTDGLTPEDQKALERLKQAQPKKKKPTGKISKAMREKMSTPIGFLTEEEKSQAGD